MSDVDQIDQAFQSLGARFDEALYNLLNDNLDRIVALYESAIESDDNSIALAAINQLENRVLGYPLKKVQLVGGVPDTETLLRLLLEGEEGEQGL
jgi:hypothetical protein